jgi:LPS-assembly protein
VSAESSYTNFWKETGATQRFDAFSVAVWQQSTPPGVLLTPRLGVRETAYRQDDSLGGDVRRTLGVAGLGASAHARRAWRTDRGGTIVHRLEPALLYTYIGNPRATAYPQFDEVDSIQEQSLVTATFANRLTVPDAMTASSDWQPLWVRFTQSYRLANRPGGAAWSSLRGEATIRSQRVFELDIDTFYDYELKTLTVFDTELRATLSHYGDIAVGHRSTRPEVALPRKGDILDPLALGGLVTDPHPEIDYYTIAARARLPWGFEVANKTYYNRQTGKYTEIGYGLQYNAQCWSVTFTYQDFPDKNEFGVMVALLGATSVQSKAVSGLFGPPTH